MRDIRSLHVRNAERLNFESHGTRSHVINNFHNFIRLIQYWSITI